MKTRIALLLVFFITISSFGQDIITKKNGEKIKVNVSEVNPDEIVYTYENETLINILSVNEIKEIQFKSGRIQKFKNISAIESPYIFDISEPKYIGNIYQINERGEILNTLEQKKASTKSNVNASALIIGIGKAKSKNFVKGDLSPIRIKKGNVLLLARVNNSKINPKEIFNVFSLETQKKKRFVQTGEANTFGTSKTMDIDFLNFKAFPYKENSFIIELEIEQEGEYAITLDTSRGTFNMFGIDSERH